MPPPPVVAAISTLDPTLFAAAIVTILASLGGVVVQIINAAAAARERRVASDERRLLTDRAETAVKVSEGVGLKADKIIESTTKIHELTNSTNSNLQKTLEVMQERVAGLEKMLAQAELTKRDTAANQAASDVHVASALLATPPAAPPHASPAPAPSSAAPAADGDATQKLTAIEHNTAVTAEHTALLERVAIAEKSSKKGAA